MFTRQFILPVLLLISAGAYAKQINENAIPETVSAFQQTNAAGSVLAKWYNKGTVVAGLPTDFFDQSSTNAGDSVVSWVWDFGEQKPNSYYRNPHYTYSEPGTYFVTLLVTTASGEQSMISSAIEVEPYDGITRFGFSAVQDLPNPAKGHFILLLPGSSANATIQIADQNGTIIRRENASGKEQMEFFLHVPSGIYLIEYRSEENRYFQKIQID